MMNFHSESVDFVNFCQQRRRGAAKAGVISVPCRGRTRPDPQRRAPRYMLAIVAQPCESCNRAIHQAVLDGALITGVQLAPCKS